jgi:putative acetyltransferase
VAAVEAFGPDAYDEDQVEAWAVAANPDFADGQHWLVAERDETVTGWGRLDPEAGEVTGTYVHPDHAREGVGTALLAALEGYARGAGIADLYLWASRNAVGFYERAGYTVAERASHPFGETNLTIVRVEKSLAGRSG